MTGITTTNAMTTDDATMLSSALLHTLPLPLSITFTRRAKATSGASSSTNAPVPEITQQPQQQQEHAPATTSSPTTASSSSTAATAAASLIASVDAQMLADARHMYAFLATQERVYVDRLIDFARLNLTSALQPPSSAPSSASSAPSASSSPSPAALPTNEQVLEIIAQGNWKRSAQLSSFIQKIGLLFRAIRQEIVDQLLASAMLATPSSSSSSSSSLSSSSRSRSDRRTSVDPAVRSLASAQLHRLLVTSVTRTAPSRTPTVPHVAHVADGAGATHAAAAATVAPAQAHVVGVEQRSSDPPLSSPLTGTVTTSAELVSDRSDESLGDAQHSPHANLLMLLKSALHQNREAGREKGDGDDDGGDSDDDDDDHDDEQEEDARMGNDAPVEPSDASSAPASINKRKRGAAAVEHVVIVSNVPTPASDPTASSPSPAKRSKTSTGRAVVATASAHSPAAASPTTASPASQQQRPQPPRKQRDAPAASGRRRRGALSKESVDILRQYLFQHFHHPYPSDDDKRMLAEQTGLDVNQVNYWFINARVRIWRPLLESHSRAAQASQAAAAAATGASPETVAAANAPSAPAIQLVVHDPARMDEHDEA